MFAKTWGATVTGLEGLAVSVEVDISQGLPCFEIVGLPTTAVREARERVRAAIRNSGFEFPLSRIIVNLAPADIRKDTSGLDLPIAIGILLASGQLTSQKLLNIKNTLFIGELSLTGIVKPVTGTVAMILGQRKYAWHQIILCEENYLEVQDIFEGKLIGTKSLKEMAVYITHQIEDNVLIRNEVKEQIAIDKSLLSNELLDEDFSDVQGQIVARRAMEIVAAGFHNIILSGPPGAGKTMLARRLIGILPPLDYDEKIEVSKIYSVAGILERGLLQSRPFRSPHHTVTMSAMVGGGIIPKPGELTLSHHGVLFLDEVPEFSRNVLEVLRQPLEEGVIHIARGNGNFTFPSRQILVMAKNPCPCGWSGSIDHPCTCSSGDIYRYNHKLSGPLLDRMDLSIKVMRPTYEEVTSSCTNEPSYKIRNRVMAARERALFRSAKVLKAKGILNGRLTHRQLNSICKLDHSAKLLLKDVFVKLHLSARSHDKFIKVAQTIADLNEVDTIKAEHIAEVVSYRHEEE